MQGRVWLAVVVVSMLAGGAGAAERVLFHHPDATGNLLALTDENAIVVWSAEPRPFGGGTASSNQFPRRFTGASLEADWSDEGLYPVGPRLYDPTIGRFLEPDPVDPLARDLSDPEAFQPYPYALGQPYRLADRSGRNEATQRKISAATDALYDGIKKAELSKRQVSTIERLTSKLKAVDRVVLFDVAKQLEKLGADPDGKAVRAILAKAESNPGLRRGGAYEQFFNQLNIKKTLSKRLRGKGGTLAIVIGLMTVGPDALAATQAVGIDAQAEASGSLAISLASAIGMPDISDPMAANDPITGPFVIILKGLFDSAKTSNQLFFDGDEKLPESPEEILRRLTSGDVGDWLAKYTIE